MRNCRLPATSLVWPTLAHQPMRQVQASNRQHPDMFIYSSLDRDSLQKLLANAFAVQQSQMDKQWLSAIVEVQGLIGRRELDVDPTIPFLVPRAHKLSNPPLAATP